MTRKHVDANLSAAQIELNNVIEASNMDLLIEFCKTDLGIACVLREFVLDELKSGILKEVRILKNPPGRNIGFAYHPQSIKDNPRSRFYCPGVFFRMDRPAFRCFIPFKMLSRSHFCHLIPPYLIFFHLLNQLQ